MEVDFSRGKDPLKEYMKHLENGAYCLQVFLKDMNTQRLVSLVLLFHCIHSNAFLPSISTREHRRKETSLEPGIFFPTPFSFSWHVHNSQETESAETPSLPSRAWNSLVRFRHQACFLCFTPFLLKVSRRDSLGGDAHSNTVLFLEVPPPPLLNPPASMCVIPVLWYITDSDKEFHCMQNGRKSQNLRRLLPKCQLVSFKGNNEHKSLLEYSWSQLFFYYWKKKLPRQNSFSTIDVLRSNQHTQLKTGGKGTYFHNLYLANHQHIG